MSELFVNARISKDYSFKFTSSTEEPDRNETQRARNTVADVRMGEHCTTQIKAIKKGCICTRVT